MDLTSLRQPAKVQSSGPSNLKNQPEPGRTVPRGAHLPQPNAQLNEYGAVFVLNINQKESHLGILGGPPEYVSHLKDPAGHPQGPGVGPGPQGP